MNEFSPQESQVRKNLTIKYLLQSSTWEENTFAACQAIDLVRFLLQGLPSSSSFTSEGGKKVFDLLQGRVEKDSLCTKNSWPEAWRSRWVWVFAQGFLPDCLTSCPPFCWPSLSWLSLDGSKLNARSHRTQGPVEEVFPKWPTVSNGRPQASYLFS